MTNWVPVPSFDFGVVGDRCSRLTEGEFMLLLWLPKARAQQTPFWYSLNNESGADPDSASVGLSVIRMTHKMLWHLSRFLAGAGRSARPLAWKKRGFAPFYTRQKYRTTACGHRIAHRKWKETKLQPGTAGPGNMLGCCTISFHFRWAILCPQAVERGEARTRQKQTDMLSIIIITFYTQFFRRIRDVDSGSFFGWNVL